MPLRRFTGTLLLALCAATAAAQEKDDGYRGIWYANQPLKNEYKYKYSGGMATYPQQHTPIAVYSFRANKTFFTYGGTVKGRHDRLLHMVSYYDHETGTVPRPTILLDKKTDDAHDNPTLAIDDAGHVWIFSNAHGTSRPSYISRSAEPYSIDSFERVQETNFSYGQPSYLPGKGFLFMHTRYKEGRFLHWMTSADGRDWSEPRLLARIEKGHYQVSSTDGAARLATAFNYHPEPVGLNARTSLYYLETRDHGATWTSVRGEKIDPPLTEAQNPALVRDYRKEGLLVYLKDVTFDAGGNPVILYLTSKGFESGPENDPRTWRTARWTGGEWEFRELTTSDHNYDYGALTVEPDGTWRMIGATEPGPQRYNTGGEIALWTSANRGATWTKKQLTSGSEYNHTYPRRPVHAHPDFYAIWADGHGRQPSESRLYFTNRTGDHVWMLPVKMEGGTAKPEVVATPR